ncbi:PDZ domain-containing protein 11 [Cyanistes caeruleus]|nr:PDZ domain-containing protein 11 [Cyanistes caeruleus]
MERKPRAGCGVGAGAERARPGPARCLWAAAGLTWNRRCSFQWRRRNAAARPPQRVYHPDYNNELTQFLPRTIVLKKPPGAQLGFNIRGGKASQLGIFISKVIPDSDAHRAGLQEGDQVLSVNDVDFQDIEHSKAVEILKTAREITMRVRYFPYNYQRQKERTVH